MKMPNRNCIIKHNIAFLIVSVMTAGFPVQAYSASSNLNKLRKQLETIASGFNGKIGVSLHHLKTKDKLDLRGDEKFPTGSTIKVAVLGTAMEKVERGELGYY
jgi:beta-lactamase class A